MYIFSLEIGIIEKYFQRYQNDKSLRDFLVSILAFGWITITDHAEWLVFNKTVYLSQNFANSYQTVCI